MVKKNFWVIACCLLFVLILEVKTYPKETYFDFELPARLLLTDYDYRIKFSFLISGAEAKDFTVMPIMENGTLEIYDEGKKLWIKSGALRAGFPRLASEMRVKVTSFGESRSEICFEVQHVKTMNIFKTPCKTYWNRAYLGRYINLINDRILKWKG